jgi:hypothetical protein
VNAQHVAELVGIAVKIVGHHITGVFGEQVCVVRQQDLSGFLFHLVIGDPEDTLAHRHDEATRRVALADGIPPDQLIVILLMLRFPQLRQRGVRAAIVHDFL